jgi:hypothetical protein
MNRVKHFIFIAIIIISPVYIAAQQVSPIPVFEQEIRKGTSLKMRSSELERIKRDANKSTAGNSNLKSKIKFAEIKKDFEKIQKLQNSIIKAYTTGKKVNYSKISKSAESMTTNARRLGANLFRADSEKEIGDQKPQKKVRKDVRDLIIELDNSIGIFIANPIFKDINVVDLKSSRKAQADLIKIIGLSQNLSDLAAIMK